MSDRKSEKKALSTKGKFILYRQSYHAFCHEHDNKLLSRYYCTFINQINIKEFGLSTVHVKYYIKLLVRSAEIDPQDLEILIQYVLCTDGYRQKLLWLSQTRLLKSFRTKVVEGSVKNGNFGVTWKCICVYLLCSLITRAALILVLRAGPALEPSVPRQIQETRGRVSQNCTSGSGFSQSSFLTLWTISPQLKIMSTRVIEVLKMGKNKCILFTVTCRGQWKALC